MKAPNRYTDELQMQVLKLLGIDIRSVRVRSVFMTTEKLVIECYTTDEHGQVFVNPATNKRDTYLLEYDKERYVKANGR